MFKGYFTGYFTDVQNLEMGVLDSTTFSPHEVKNHKVKMSHYI